MSSNGAQTALVSTRIREDRGSSDGRSLHALPERDTHRQLSTPGSWNQLQPRHCSVNDSDSWYVDAQASRSSSEPAARAWDEVTAVSSPGLASSTSTASADGFDSTPRSALIRKENDWRFWVTKPTHLPCWNPVPPGFVPKYTSLSTVRQERKLVTKRSIRKIGRIPLKEYLEVGDDYLAVRRTARKCVAAWLQPHLRMAKQESQRVMACIHKLEYDHPILAQCEDHWKARSTIGQVVDNAFDELTLQRRKAGKLAGKATSTDGSADSPQAPGVVDL